MQNAQTREALKASDFGLLGASWWPRARFNRLRVVTYFATWVCNLESRVLRDHAQQKNWSSFLSGTTVYVDTPMEDARGEIRLIRALEIDLEGGSLHSDIEGAQDYRAETLDYVRFCLGLVSDQDWALSKPSSCIVRSFEEIGEAIRLVYNSGKGGSIIVGIL